MASFVPWSVLQQGSCTVIQEYIGSAVHMYSCSVVFTVVQIDNCTLLQFYSCAVVQLCSCAVVQLCSCAVVQLYSCAVVQLSSCPVVQLYSCIVVQLCSCTILQLCSCPVVQLQAVVPKAGQAASVSSSSRLAAILKEAFRAAPPASTANRNRNTNEDSRCLGFIFWVQNSSIFYIFIINQFF